MTCISISNEILVVFYFVIAFFLLADEETSLHISVFSSMKQPIRRLLSVPSDISFPPYNELKLNYACGHSNIYCKKTSTDLIFFGRILR